MARKSKSGSNRPDSNRPNPNAPYSPIPHITPVRISTSSIVARTMASPERTRQMAAEGTLTPEMFAPQNRPILSRNSFVRFARTESPYPRLKVRGDGRGGRGRPRVTELWRPICITIPKEVAQVSGIENGMTVVIEAYRDKLVIFAAGDLMSREEAMI